VGLNVYLEYKGERSTQTDQSGYFSFSQDPAGFPIQTNTPYLITINGAITGTLGTKAENPLWGQWAGYFWTDSIGNAARHIDLQAATPVLVPYATFYVNTPYVQQASYSASSYHDLSFKSEIGGNGFQSTTSMTVGLTWTVYTMGTNVEREYGREWYAVGYLDEQLYDLSHGGEGAIQLDNVGLSRVYDQYVLVNTQDVQEYLTPVLTKPNYGLPSNSVPIGVHMDGQQSFTFSYSETGSVTWSYGASGSVGINFLCFGFSVNIDTTATVTQGHTDTVTFLLGPMPVGEPYHTFVIYTGGFSFTEPNNNPSDPANEGGLELHIWDMGANT
jgi:hypothetical protein